jgi:Ca2+/Na+ antiporter
MTLLMVEATNQVGMILKIDTAIMGLVFLAAGASVPDTIASVIVAKQGEANMAVSNAIGSNCFDILLGECRFDFFHLLFQASVFHGLCQL